MAEKKAKKADVKKEVKAAEKKLRDVGGSNPWETLMYPHLAEKSMKMVEAENKLVFMVRRNARKGQIPNSTSGHHGGRNRKNPRPS